MFGHVKDIEKRKVFSDHMKEVLKTVKQRFRRVMKTEDEVNISIFKYMIFDDCPLDMFFMIILINVHRWIVTNKPNY